VTVYVETASGTPSFHIDDFTMSFVPATPIQTDIPSLKTALAADFPIGAAVALPQTLGERARLLTRHFSQVTPGNALKWDATEPSGGDVPLHRCRRDRGVREGERPAGTGHTLVWHQQTPAWVFNDANGQPMTATAANKTLLLSRLEAHIRAVAGRYANDLYAWDVVNEVIDENQSDGMRRSTWFTITGLDYIRTAFRVAREVAPKRQALHQRLQHQRAGQAGQAVRVGPAAEGRGRADRRRRPPDALQCGLPSAADTDAMIAKFIPLGVLQEITEMDVSIYTNSGESFPTPPAERLTRQADRYRALFDVYRKVPGQPGLGDAVGASPTTTPGSTRSRWPARTRHCCSTWRCRPSRRTGA
jgi:endo-1,4-beta-xylanase